MKTFHTWVKSNDLDRATDKLDELVALGWRLVQAYATHSFGVSGETYHYFILAREERED